MLHHCTRVYSQHFGATVTELKQEVVQEHDAHSKFHKNKQITAIILTSNLIKEI